MHEYISKLQMDNTKPQSLLEYTTSTLKLGLQSLRLTNPKYPISNRINYDLVKLCKIESPTDHSINLSLSIMLQSLPIKQALYPRYSKFI